MGIYRGPNLGKLSDPRVRAALYYARKRRLKRLEEQQNPPETDPEEETP